MANTNGSARFACQRTGEFVTVGFFCVGKGIVWDSAACFAGHREALCPALNLFLYLLFFLDKKSNKKVKANAIAPQALPGHRTGEFEIVRLFTAGEGMV